MADPQGGTLAFGADAERLITLADKAAAAIASGAPSRRLFDSWRVIARALWLAQTAIAERHGGRAGHLGEPWRRWLAQHPGLAALKSSERSHSTWLAQHEGEVCQWRDALPQRERDRVHHPATARLGFQRYLREQQIVLALKTKGEAADRKREDLRCAVTRAEKVIADMAQRFAAMEGEVMTLRGRVASLEAVATGAMIQPEQARRTVKAA